MKNDNDKKLQPLGNRLLVSIIQNESQTTIVLPDSAKGKSRKGKVIALGDGGEKPDVLMKKVTIEDTVIFKEWSGTEIELSDSHKVNAKKYLIVSIEDVLGIIK